MNFLQQAVQGGQIVFGPPTFNEWLMEEAVTQILSDGHALITAGALQLEVDFSEY